MNTTLHLFRNLVALSGATLIAATASSQSIVARTTDMNWHTLYGGGPTIIEKSDSFSSTDIESSFVHHMGYEDHAVGDFPLDWTANVQVDVEQSFNIQGPLSGFSSVSTSMTSSKLQSATGIGGAGIDSGLPGNLLTLDFEVTEPFDYDLSGNLEYGANGANVYAYVMLLKDLGSSWVALYDTRQTGIGNIGNFTKTGNLEAGHYRLLSQVELSLGLTSHQSQYNYTFTNLNAVPEPASFLALSLGGLLALRRNKTA